MQVPTQPPPTSSQKVLARSIDWLAKIRPFRRRETSAVVYAAKESDQLLDMAEHTIPFNDAGVRLQLRQSRGTEVRSVVASSREHKGTPTTTQVSGTPKLSTEWRSARDKALCSIEGLSRSQFNCLFRSCSPGVRNGIGQLPDADSYVCRAYRVLTGPTWISAKYWSGR